MNRLVEVKKKKIIIVAGEASGDLNGAALALSLKKLEPDLEITGIGGKQMREAGVETVSDISELAVVGFTEVLGNILRLREVFKRFCRRLDLEKPDALVLVDYPGFNIRLAEQAKRRGITTIYFISPQVWAWGRNRVKKLASFVDKMLVIFPFEKDFYEGSGLDVEFVGHPMLDRIKMRLSDEELASRYSLATSATTVAFLPGSRRQEVRRHLPVMLKAGIIMKKKNPGLQFVLPCAPTVNSRELSDIVKKYPLEVTVIENYVYETLHYSDLVISCSGTATLESAYFKKPAIVIYSVSFFTWLIAKVLIKLRNIAMVNIIAGRKVVPEFLQFSARPLRIANEAIRILEDAVYKTRIVEEIEKVRDALGSPGAGERAAKAILKVIEGNN